MSVENIRVTMTKRVLILCTGNSARTQIGDALAATFRDFAIAFGSAIE